MRHRFIFPLFVLAGLVSCCGFSAAMPAQDDWILQIDAARELGPSRIESFMFVQGGALQAGDEQGSNEASRQFELAAWKALDLSAENVSVFDEGEGSALLSIVRTVSPPPDAIGPLGPNGDLYLDPKYFEGQLASIRQTFGIGSEKGFLRVLWVTAMPKVLSSNPGAQNYATYPPANYAEWRAVLEAAVRYLNRHGIDDPYFIVFGEPESDTVFNVLSPDGTPYPISTEPVLREYVRLYAESQRAVKAADPEAKVSAMCAGVWSADLFRELRAAPEQKGLDDFIAYVRDYNAALPPGVPPAELDNICWQGYSWKDEKRLIPMAEYIQSTLAAYGFDPDTPQYLSGWSGGWASPRGTNYPVGLYAPHLVYNVLDLLNPGGRPGPIAQAHYYTWNLEAENNLRSSLVRTVHADIDYGLGEVVAAASDQNCLRPAYTAFLALKAMEKDHVLAMNETRPLLARSLATVGAEGIRILLVNYTDQRQDVQLTIKNLPETAKVNEAVLRRVPEGEICGQENWFPANDPMSLFLSEAAAFTANEPGTAAISIELAANTVGLLDIPRTQIQQAEPPAPAENENNNRAGGALIILGIAGILAGGVLWVLYRILRKI